MMIVMILINTIFILNLRELAFPHQYQFDGNSNLVYTIIRQVTDTETQRRIKSPGFRIFLLSDSTPDIFFRLKSTMFTLLTIRKRTAFHQLANLPSDCSSIRWGLPTLITSYQSQAVCWSVFNQGQTLNSFNFSSNTCCRLHLFLVINRITINDCSSLIFHWAGFSITFLPSKNMKKKGKKSPLTRKDSVHEEAMEVCSKQSVNG